MKQMDLFDELTYIDDAFVLEAHETPVLQHSRFTLRRTVVLLAAVITVVAMSVAAVATMTEDPDTKLLMLWNKMVRGGHQGSFSYDDNYRYELHQNPETLDDREVEINTFYVCSLNHAKLRVVCEGETLEVKLEAMVLMDDGQVRYKSRTIQGDGEVTVALDNLIAGEPGAIIYLRRTTSLLGNEGWETLHPWNTYIADDFGYPVPVGTDVRFPDMRYNYDGRGSSQTEELPAPIIPDNSNIIDMVQ